MKKGELDLEHLQEEHRDKLFDLRKEHRAELEGRLAEEKSMWEGEVAALKDAHAQEKSHILQENGKERAKLIKKYEEKIYVSHASRRTSRARAKSSSRRPPRTTARRWRL